MPAATAATITSIFKVVGSEHKHPFLHIVIPACNKRAGIIIFWLGLVGVLFAHERAKTEG